MTRVIQWATGITGMMRLRHVIGRPDLELVGVRVYDPAKAGVDAGTLCGLPDTGIIATDDRDALHRRRRRCGALHGQGGDRYTRLLRRRL